MDQNINMKSNKTGGNREESKSASGPISGSHGGRNSQYYPEFLKKATHPGTCLWHMVFKAAAIVSYFFFGIFGFAEVMVFISVILLSAVDFWVVKNITGRLLVGLRWWSQVKEDGTEQWFFESLDEKKNTGVDSFIFWATLYITPVVWAILAIAGILSFKLYNVTLCVSVMLLSGTNLYGYIK